MTDTVVEKKAPEIHLRLSIDGKVREVDIVADSQEDRDQALGALKQILPAVELIETLLKEPQ